ncbi:MAG: hypothetical protein US42_C0005G0025 [Candidatus Magasanikbacteria bacterium GW2011_GWC2_37_14]|uniref:PQ loop repeat protein n=1 Tax=Candidatus Magasanikbacteria bacterium GW2011_GWC2_37_14 TaxID=1619046 RepID=A0A0G0GNR1_9BACT|nr:MAG: hypothetical protein US42_C0005G0025 [Candidatus Magasanikbacteria bacterium GW2011_GWC2_37_14]
MLWQDIIITIISIMFVFALIPQVYYGFKNKKGSIVISTSLPNSIGMYVMSIVYLTLSLKFSALLGFFTASLWLTLFIQKIVYK